MLAAVDKWVSHLKFPRMQNPAASQEQEQSSYVYMVVALICVTGTWPFFPLLCTGHTGGLMAYSGGALEEYVVIANLLCIRFSEGIIIVHSKYAVIIVNITTNCI